MPPSVPRKRLRDEDGESSQKKAKTVATKAPPRKPTLFDDLDATSTPRTSGRSSRAPVKYGDSSDDESALSSLSDADFEDVLTAKPPKADEPSDDDDDDIEFEDVPHVASAVPEGPEPSGDLELTLYRDPHVSYEDALGDKKGPTKRERRIRITTHCVHVQFLMWHNAIRNSWLCDPEVQGLLLSHLSPSLWEEVERWRRNSGLQPQGESKPKVSKDTKGKGKSKPTPKGKGKKGAEKPSRDWGDAAERLEKGAVNMSHGDPLFRLVKALAAWWRQRFRITAPGLRKLGWMKLQRLSRLTKEFENDKDNHELFGERIRNIEDFKRRAQECTGSRDLGAQLFTALLRGLGLEARMVANLQPVGFSWTKLEEADPEKEDEKAEKTQPPVEPAKKAAKTKASKVSKPSQPTRSSRRTNQKHTKADAEDSDDFDMLEENSDNDSVIELPTPKKGAKSKVYDKDLEFPHYWTEILSPVTNKYLSVDVIVKNIVATNRELVEAFEPRGGQADKAKQVMAYIVGFSPDGTAKDVTVRYLKRQTLPGKTKGMRIPVEKIPVHNKNGKVKKYEQFDWFRSVMRAYARGDRKHPLTEVDDEEDSTDLKPAKPQKKEVKEGEETLQYYKQSQEFALERHLRREEALLPTAEPVKVFKNKGKGGKIEEEPVYLRKDVVQVKSAETWHKQGRAPIAGEQPLKKVPYRAATTNRRREIAEAEAATGQKVLQGLYSFDQTDWIIPDPIRDGIIPKNDYGNIDLFVEHMCPEGAVHVPYRGAVRVCKRIGIDYAEAVVDFEFGHRMAVPVIQGVVIAVEYHDQVMEELAKDEAERSRKEDEKRRKAALAQWRKLLMGMRIVERIRREYGGLKDDFVAFGHSRGADNDVLESALADEDMAGGFLPAGFEEDVQEEPRQTSSFFPVVDENDHSGDNDGEDALMVEDGDSELVSGHTYSTPQSGAVAQEEEVKPRGRRTAQRARRTVPSSEDEEDSMDSAESDDDYEA